MLNLPRITAYVVNSHALPTVPVYKKNKIASLLCIFEATILVSAVFIMSPSVLSLLLRMKRSKETKCQKI